MPHSVGNNIATLLQHIYVTSCRSREASLTPNHTRVRIKLCRSVTTAVCPRNTRVRDWRGLELFSMSATTMRGFSCVL